MSATCRCVPLIAIALLCACSARGPAAADARIAALLAATPLIDGHNDLLIHYVGEGGKRFSTADTYDVARRTKGQVDIPRLRAGMVGGALFTVAILNQEDREAGIRESTDLFRAIAARHPRDFEVVTDANGFERAFADRRIGALLALEGGEQIGTSLDMLDTIHRHGVRAMTLVWEKTNEIGDAYAGPPRHDGLSPFGLDVVAAMNRLGLVIDLSHAADATARDAIAASRAPVILSHSSARAICPAPRNVSDEVLRALAAKGGVAMVSFVPYFTTPEAWSWYQRGEAQWAELTRVHGTDKAAIAKAMEDWDARNPQPAVSLGDVADHIDHVRRVAGIDHVGLGSDFDGMGAFSVADLEDASTFPALLRDLARRGWSDADLAKLAGGNFLRVLREVEVTASPGDRRVE